QNRSQYFRSLIGLSGPVSPLWPPQTTLFDIKEQAFDRPFHHGTDFPFVGPPVPPVSGGEDPRINGGGRRLTVWPRDVTEMAAFSVTDRRVFRRG
ncbi:MAG TPA: hypothetical protein VGS02_15785, partial [Acidobacteriaceae bacterium]|nr:hypothetical protein [Acidobacteriaceae bacterium]